MSVYKCISCGAERESDKRCSCPNCGYWMFETPYDRKARLISEIEGFFCRLKVISVQRSDLVFEGKEADDHRFPDYDRILKYVSGKNRTEDFLRNLSETTDQLKKHFTARFSQIYPVSFEPLDKIMQQYDEVLCAAAKVLSPDLTVEIPLVKWEKVSLLYTETPNKYLWFSVSELIERIEELAQKITKFIKINNLYGDGHKYHPPKRASGYSEKTDFKDELEEAILSTEKILKKKYIVDIMDDGSAELREMLSCLWRGIELILAAPLFVKTYEYALGSQTVDEETLLCQSSAVAAERYAQFDSAVDVDFILREKTDDALFEAYRALISLDKFGFLVSPGTTFLHIGESEKKLNALIGLSSIKDSVQKIKSFAMANKGAENLNLHMCFYGNPGTGKTEVARIIAGILYENGILPANRVVEVDRGGLVGQYVGETPQKTMRKIQEAMGGVLFVDEAYALAPKGTGFDYGHEAVATLIKAMEDYRGKFCVILAGYRNQMHEMISINPGFQSRIQFELDFPNYNREEMGQIAELMMRQRGYFASKETIHKILDVTDMARKDPNFANAREIRNILDQVIMCQNLRCTGTDDRELGIVDVNRFIKDNHINLPTVGTGSRAKILTAEEELDQLIGLAAVKRMVKKIRAYAKRNQQDENFNLHMCFCGNPGTGKTEVARILSRILYDAGVLAEAKLVETDAHGLIGRYVGETAPKTLEKVREAMGGVLFVDEAYTLASTNGENRVKSYGDEAVAVLLKEMEDHRGKFCVILAGYPKEMQAMIGRNPGLKSRVPFTLEFPDYTREELGAIAEAFLRKKGYEIDLVALEKLLDVTEYYRKQPDFANARTIRNILDQVIMNQNLRTEEEVQPDNQILLSDVEDYILDEQIDLQGKNNSTRKIGFV